MTRTVRFAEDAVEFDPTDVVSDPTGIVLAKIPLAAEVTTTETEQLPPGCIAVATGKDMLLPPAVAKKPAEQVVDATKGDALIRLGGSGYWSVNAELNVAVVSL